MPHEEDASAQIVRDEDLEQNRTSSQDARSRGGLEEQDAAGIPRPNDDKGPDADSGERQPIGNDDRDAK